jgi:hypothetical protein
VELSRAWNERFQRVLHEPDSIAKFKKLSNLAQNFVFTAEQVILQSLRLCLIQRACVQGSMAHLKYNYISRVNA